MKNLPLLTMIQNIICMPIEYLVIFIICNTRLYAVNKDKCSHDIREPCIPYMLVAINMMQSI
jgi:hypothetical protein